MITSTSNAKVKRLVNLRKKRRARDAEGVFLTEGLRMFQEVQESELKELYVTERFYEKEKKLVDEKCRAGRCGIEVFSETVMEYVSDTRHPQGVLCVVRQRNGPYTMLSPRTDLEIRFAANSSTTLTTDFTMPITVDSGIFPF